MESMLWICEYASLLTKAWHEPSGSPAQAQHAEDSDRGRILVWYTPPSSSKRLPIFREHQQASNTALARTCTFKGRAPPTAFRGRSQPPQHAVLAPISRDRHRQASMDLLPPAELLPPLSGLSPTGPPSSAGSGHRRCASAPALSVEALAAAALQLETTPCSVLELRSLSDAVSVRLQRTLQVSVWGGPWVGLGGFTTYQHSTGQPQRPPALSILNEEHMGT